VSASAFFFKSEWPFLAPTSLIFITWRFCRVGNTLSRTPPDDIWTL